MIFIHETESNPSNSPYMNPLHYPDLERCKKLTEIGFPETENYLYENLYIVKKGLDVDLARHNKVPVFVCPSVMEMLDVIPEHIGGYDLVLYNRAVSYEDSVMLDNVNFKWDIYNEQLPFTADTLPNALCDLIFWLVEQKYLTL